MQKYTKIIFTDRYMMYPSGKVYTYRTPDFGVKEGDLVVMEAGDGMSIGQVVGFINEINFPESKLKNIIQVITQEEQANV